MSHEIPMTDAELARWLVNVIEQTKSKDGKIVTALRTIQDLRHDVRLATLDEVYQRAGQLVPEACADKQGQHVGIASVREIIAELMAPLVKS